MEGNSAWKRAFLWMTHEVDAAAKGGKNVVESSRLGLDARILDSWVHGLCAVIE